MPKNFGDNLEEGFEQENKQNEVVEQDEEAEQETEQNFETASQNVEGNTEKETLNNAQNELQKQFDVFQILGNESASRIARVEGGENANAFLKAQFAELKTSVTELSGAPAERKEEIVDKITENANELANLDNQQRAIGENSFQSVKKHKKGVGFGRWLLRGIGLPIAGILGVVAGICTGIGTLGYKLYNGIRWSGKLKKAQPTLEMKLPGLDVEENETRPNVNELGDDQDILDDIRRVPLVWEKSIPENPDQKPYLLVKVKKAEGLEYGHVFLSLCYSRMNPLQKKMERYNAQFGFYPKDKLINCISGTLKETQTSALIPGILKNDETHDFDMSKKYVVNNKQINQILTESETYENGGYSLIKRNCTTFVAEVTKNAGVKTESIFREEDFEMQEYLWIANKAGIGRMLMPFANQIVKNEIMKETQEDDFSYNRFGQKKATKEEVERMEKTSKLSSLVGYSPSSVANAMEEEGISTLHRKEDKENVGSMQKYFIDATTVFTNALYRLANSMPASEKMSFINKCSTFYEAEISDRYKTYFKNVPEQENAPMTVENMRIANEILEVIRERVSDWFNYTLEKDDKVSPIVFDYIKKLTLLQDRLWDKYNQNEKKKIDKNSDLTYYMEAFFQEAAVGGGTISSAMLSASARMYKTMLTAITDRKELASVNRQMAEGKLSKNNKKAAKLIVKNDTLNDFANAERYYLMKKTFNQKDADYAFDELVNYEAKLDNNLVVKKRTSKTYQAFALEKIFGGLKPVLTEQLNKTGDEKQLVERIYEHLSECLLEEEKAARMKLILLSMHKNKAFTSKQDAVNRIEEVFRKVYLKNILLRIFLEVQNGGTEWKEDVILRYLKKNFGEEKEDILQEKEFAKLI